MASASILMSRLLSMMIIVAVGYAAVKLRVVDSASSKVLSRISVYILQPCMIFYAFQIEITPERLHGFLLTLLFGMLVYVIWIVGLERLKKPLRLDAIDRCTLIYSNVGALILPIVNMILGIEYVFYTSALQIPFNLFVWTHGLRVISHEKRFSFKKVLLNPNMIALFAGLAACILQIRLPDVLDTPVALLVNMIGPVSMMVIGINIAGERLGKMFSSRRAWLISACRLLVMPLTVLLLLYLCGIHVRHPELIPVFQVSFIALAAPPASTISQLAVLYDRRPYDAAVYNVLSTVACILTMPLMLKLYEIVLT